MPVVSGLYRRRDCATPARGSPPDARNLPPILLSAQLVMKPYQYITLHEGDCMDILPAMASQSFDLAIVDPPYFSGPERRQFTAARFLLSGLPDGTTR